MTKSWKKVECWRCSGYGLVSGYTADGSDFTGADECDICNGTGTLFVGAHGAVAQWPGGPFVGRLAKLQLAKG